MTGERAEGPAADEGVERLLALLWLFRVPGALRSDHEIEACGYPDLHGEESVGRRNFGNDRNRLAALGIEVERLPDGGGWRLADSSDLTAVQFTEAERDALLEAEILLAGDTARPAPGPVVPIPGAVPTLLAACRGRHPVRFPYGGRTRTVHPGTVTVSGTGFWYLQAQDPSSGEHRTFRVDRITGPVDVDRDHSVPTPPSRPSLHPTAWDVDDPVDAVVVFEHEPLPEWLAMLGPCTRDPDASRTWRWCATNHDAFVARVLAIGPAARLLEPPALVARLRRVLADHVAACGTP